MGKYEIKFPFLFERKIRAKKQDKSEGNLRSKRGLQDVFLFHKNLVPPGRAFSMKNGRSPSFLKP